MTSLAYTHTTAVCPHSCFCPGLCRMHNCVQGEELEPARAKAEGFGVKQIFIDDLREEFVKDYVFPMFRGNALYEGIYLLGTSIARPLIAKRQIEIAKECGADAVSHGATGKGNDQIRFEVRCDASLTALDTYACLRQATCCADTADVCAR